MISISQWGLIECDALKFKGEIYVIYTDPRQWGPKAWLSKGEP